MLTPEELRRAAEHEDLMNEISEKVKKLQAEKAEKIKLLKEVLSSLSLLVQKCKY
jgi:hypothetical protein